MRRGGRLYVGANQRERQRSQKRSAEPYERNPRGGRRLYARSEGRAPVVTSWEAISACAAVGTFFVIAASAIAAVVQLRHLRLSNQISTMLEYERLLLDESFLEKRSELTERMDEWVRDPRLLERIAARTGREYRVITSVANVFENMGSMVRYGMLDREVTLALWSHLASVTWETLAPITALVRERIGTDALWENFEYLASLSKAWIAQDRSTYPRDVPRLPLPPPPRAEAVKGASADDR